MPHTYILPGERDQLRRKMRKVKKSFWIIKPPNLFCGMGIKVINDFKEVPVKKGPLCVQRYLKKPLLIDGLKFDLRVYVLVTSVEPLRVFLYEEGLARKPVVTLIHRIFRNKVYLKFPSTKWIISKKLSALFWQNWGQSCFIVTTELISIYNLLCNLPSSWKKNRQSSNISKSNNWHTGLRRSRIQTTLRTFRTTLSI